MSVPCGLHDDVAHLWLCISDVTIHSSSSMVQSSISFWNTRDVWWGDFVKWVPCRAVFLYGWAYLDAMNLLSTRGSRTTRLERPRGACKESKSACGSAGKTELWPWSTSVVFRIQPYLFPLPFAHADPRFSSPLPLHHQISQTLGMSWFLFASESSQTAVLFIRLFAFHLALLMAGTNFKLLFGNSYE